MTFGRQMRIFQTYFMATSDTLSSIANVLVMELMLKQSLDIGKEKAYTNFILVGSSAMMRVRVFNSIDIRRI